jgi:hypothetical protein
VAVAASAFESRVADAAERDAKIAGEAASAKTTGKTAVGEAAAVEAGADPGSGTEVPVCPAAFPRGGKNGGHRLGRPNLPLDLLHEAV